MSEFLYILMAFLLGFLVKRYKYPITRLKDEIDRKQILIKHLNRELDITKQKTFRVGDLVYANPLYRNGRFNFNQPYYIQELYNGNTCAVIYSEKEYKNGGRLFEGDWGIGIEDIQFEPFPICKCCGKPA